MNLKTCKECGIDKELSSFYSGINKKRNQPYIFAVCKSCHRNRDIRWKKSNPERVREIQKKWHHENKDILQERRVEKNKNNWLIYSNRRKELDKRRRTARNDLADKLVILQENKCAICKESFDVCGRYDVDHSHKTGFVRGLLCRKCNSGLHYFEDTSFIKKAKGYIKNHPSKKFPPVKY